LDPKDPSVTEKQKLGLNFWKEHILENVAGGNPEHARWIMGYFAHLIQRPYENPLTAIVMKGKKGTGKNSVIEPVGRLLGSLHYMVTAHKRYIMSNFNGHMERLLLLGLDEAFWSGDKSSEGVLKSLITDPNLQIEHKGHESYTVPSRLRIIVMSNEDWVVPVTEEERRFAVFNMGVKRMKDNKYFTAMEDSFKNHGGDRLLLHFLDNFDLSTVDVKNAPDTEGLAEQKIQSLEPFRQWWFNCLTEGVIISHPAFSDEWPKEIRKEEFRRAFNNYCRDRHIKSRVPDEATQGKMMADMCPGISRSQKLRDGEKLIPVFRLESLEHHRAEWDIFMKTKTDWSIT
jgi:hypothetical protein